MNTCILHFYFLKNMQVLLTYSIIAYKKSKKLVKSKWTGSQQCGNYQSKHCTRCW